MLFEANLMKITHLDLLFLAKILGFDLNPTGLCKGFTGMLGQAVFATDESSFFERLNLIAQFEDNFWNLKHKIDAIQTQSRKRRSAQFKGLLFAFKPLTIQERKLIDILSWYTGIAFYLEPAVHADFFAKNYITQTDIKTVFPLVKPFQIKQDELFILLDEDVVFDKPSLIRYLDDLIMVLATTLQPIPIYLENNYHSVFLRYNLQKGCWIYVDVEDFERYPQIESYYRELNSQELAESIFVSFGDNLLDHTLFTIIMPSLTRNDEMVTKLQLLHASFIINSERATVLNAFQSSLLLLACKNGRLNDVKKLIANNANVNQTELNSNSPLHMACQNGYPEIVKELLANHANVNQTREKMITPFWAACANGHTTIVKILLDSGLVNNINHGVTALYMACQNGHVEVVDLILSKKDINKTSTDGFTPLFIASQNGHAKIVTILLDTNLIDDVNKQCGNGGCTALYIACKNGHLDVVKELVVHHTTSMQANKDDLTPLEVAYYQGHTEIVCWLLENGFVSQKHLFEKTINALLHFACKWPSHFQSDCFKLLIKKGANLLYKNECGLTALDIAFEHDNQVVITELLNMAKEQSLNNEDVMSPKTL